MRGADPWSTLFFDKTKARSGDAVCRRAAPSNGSVSMNDFLAEHVHQLWGVAIVIALLWIAGRIIGRSRVRHGNRIPLKVYCGHCNWEGTVTPGSMACRRCRSQDVHVLAA